MLFVLRELFSLHPKPRRQNSFLELPCEQAHVGAEVSRSTRGVAGCERKIERGEAASETRKWHLFARFLPARLIALLFYTWARDSKLRLLAACLNLMYLEEVWRCRNNNISLHIDNSSCSGHCYFIELVITVTFYYVYKLKIRRHLISLFFPRQRCSP